MREGWIKRLNESPTKLVIGVPIPRSRTIRKGHSAAPRGTHLRADRLRPTDRLKVPWAAGRQLHRPSTDLESRDQFTPNVISRRRKSEKGHSSCPPCPPKALLLPSLSRFLLLLDSFPRATICYEEEKEGFPSSLSTSAASFPLIVGRY